MVDPVNLINPFLLSYVFSFLSLPERTLLAGVSHGWRLQIQRDSILNRVIDLTKLDPPLTELQTIRIIHRLALLSTHPKNEIHLNLTCFWQSFQDAVDTLNLSNINFDSLMQATSSRFISLITAISLATRGNLDKLHIKVKEEIDSENWRAFGEAFIRGAWDLETMMDNLREIVFEMPFPISLSSGSEGGKKLQVIHDVTMNDPVHFRPQDCQLLLQRVVEFTGKGLTRLSLRTESLINLDEEDLSLEETQAQIKASEKVFGEIQKSGSTLEGLELDIGAGYPLQSILQLLVRCPKLNSLKLRYFDFNSYDEESTIKRLVFPQDPGPSHLKSLELVLMCLEVNWESKSLLKWIGTELESLEIDLGFDDPPLLPKLPTKTLVEILKSNMGLKSLVLKELHLDGPSRSALSRQVSLPTLKSLELSGIYLFGYDLFGNSILPSIECLTINAADIHGSETLSGFLPLLQCCSSTLKRLTLGDHFRPDEASPQDLTNEEASNMSISFDALKSLTVFRSSPRLDDLIKDFRFGKLQRLHIGRSSGDLIQHLFHHQALPSTFLSSFYFGVRDASESKPVKPISNATFSNLGMLWVEEDFMMLDFFKEAKFQRLQSIMVSAPRFHGTDSKIKAANQSSFLGDPINVEGLISLFESNSTTLQSISLSSNSKSDSPTSFNSDALEPIHFHNLKSLSLNSCPHVFILFTTKSCIMNNLTKLSLNNFDGMKLNPLLLMIKSICRPLTSLDLRLRKCQKEEIDLQEIEKGLCFPNLEEMSLGWIGLEVVELLSHSRYPQLKKLKNYERKPASGGSEPSVIDSTQTPDHFRAYMEALLSRAPNLKKIDTQFTY